MKLLRTFDTELRRNLLFLFAAGLLFWSSIGSLIPTVPLYLEKIGASKQQIGIVIGSFAIGILLCRGVFGRLADRRGRRIVLLIGTIIVAIAPFGYLGLTSIPLLIALRAFHGVSMAAFTTAYLALVSDLAPVENRGQIIGYMSLVAPLGIAVGPASGGYIQTGIGFPALFIFASGLGWLAFLCILPIINTPISTQQQDRSRSSIWKILSSPKVKVPAAIMLLLGLDLGTLHTFAPLYIESAKVDLNVGLFYTAEAITSFSIRLFIGRASDRLGRGLFISLSLIVYILAMILFWRANSTYTFLLAAIIEGAGIGALIPMISTLMTDRALPQERGRVFAVFGLGSDLGFALAGSIFGSFSEQLGYRTMFGFAALLTFLAFIIFVTLCNKDLHSSLRFAFGRGEDDYAVRS